MKRRIAFVLVVLIPIVTGLALMGYGLHKYEMKFIRDAIEVITLGGAVGIPTLLLIWAFGVLVNDDEPYIVKNKR